MAEISILMPIYNAEDYLKECLDSIVAQNYKDFEVLMVNDGSTDNSGTICDEYAQIDSRFFVRHQENGGGGVARNALLNWVRESNSKYVVWVDADDLIAVDYLDFLHRKIEENPEYNIVQCDFTTDIKVYELENSNSESSESWGITNTEMLLSEMQSGKHGMTFTVLWNKIYRKEIYEGISVITTSEISGKIYNDINILWKIYLNAGNCLVFDKIAYYYRYVETSVQHKKITERKLEFLPLYNIVYLECKKLGYHNYADFLSERMLFSLALNLSHPKEDYVDYNKFFISARNIFNNLQKKMEFRCSRPDMKLLYMIGKINFMAFRIYGRLYDKYRTLKRG